jgi:phosphohistidine swiveling domain-containing protein
MKPLEAIRWRFIHERKRSPFFAFVFLGGCSSLRTDIGFDYTSSPVGIFDGNILWEEDAWMRVDRRIRSRLNTNPRWFLRAMASCRKLLARRIVEWSAAAKREHSVAALPARFEHYVNSLLGFGAFVSWPAILQGPLEEVLHNELAKRFGDAAEAIYHTVTDPIDPGPSVYERISLLRIATGKGDAKKRERSIIRHSERFGWMKNVGYFAEWYPLDHYRHELERVRKDDPADALREGIAEVAAKRRRFSAVLRRIGSDIRLSTYVRIANEAVSFRSFRSELYYASYGPMRPLLSAVANRLELEPQDLVYLMPDEILRAFRTKGLGALEKIGPRRHSYVFASKPGFRYVIRAGADAATLTATVLGRLRSDDGDLVVRGQPAFKGKVRGRVVIIRSLDDLARVKRGDILVSHATNVNYLPGLRKAAGLVTEEGGILCHAAVVSRELRIPAVIGTGNATRALSDGQLVDVDADAGSVIPVRDARKHGRRRG